MQEHRGFSQAATPNPVSQYFFYSRLHCIWYINRKAEHRRNPGSQNSEHSTGLHVQLQCKQDYTTLPHIPHCELMVNGFHWHQQSLVFNRSIKGTVGTCAIGQSPVYKPWYHNVIHVQADSNKQHRSKSMQVDKLERRLVKQTNMIGNQSLFRSAQVIQEKRAKLTSSRLK